VTIALARPDCILEVQVMSAQTGTMQDYLAATKLCDSENPWLRQVAEAVVRDARTPEEKALSIFYHVRDAVRFSLAYSRSSASQTLKRGYGECGNKTNAQVALLRAVGIPARFHWVQARSKALHRLIADFVYRNMPPVASHFWCECFLSGKWVSCELMLDKPLYDGMLQEGLITKEQVPAIDWDGKTDLVLLNPWITEDRGHLPSFDDAIRVLQAGEEGMPPLWIERIIAPVFYRLNLRSSDRIRQRASG
jgi:transglutaminase-like putative cysteine protease